MGRAIEWLRRRPLETWVTFALVAGSVLFVWTALFPDLLLADTTPNGGDLGAHVWAPAFLRDELLPRWRLSGWAPDWYAGFPAYHFYMVVPSLLIVALDAAGLPYNIAFKLVSVSGLLALPVCAWAMARLARQAFPVPAAMAVAATAFVFDRSYTIYGGNALSTLAGEFAFSISLCFALLFLGVVARGLDTGRHRAWGAVLLALCVTCHLIPAVFALLGAAVLGLVSWWSGRPTAVVPAAVVPAAVVPAAVVPAGDGAGPAGDAGPAGEGAAPAGAGPAGEGAAPAGAGPAGDAPAPPTGSGARTVRWLVVVLGTGGLLSSFWTVPFLLRRAYLNDMGWQKLETYLEALFPGRIGRSLTSLFQGTPTAQVPADSTWVVVFAVVGAIAAVAFRRRFGTALVVLAAVLALAVRLAPQGRLWNARLLPFWYLSLYLLAAIAVAEVLLALTALATRADPGGGAPSSGWGARGPGLARRATLAAGVVGAALAVAVAVAFPLRMLPLATTSPDGLTYRWFGRSTTDQSLVRPWARWDYTGYERKPAHAEYDALVRTMGEVGRTEGCGRAMWEYDRSLDRFGTPMALMLLPYWTDGCIGSMEGLFFEASATTPYHFLNQSELSAAPSRAQRGLPYPPLDVSRGVGHLQLLGVRYYLAFSPAAVQQADAEADLSLVATSGVFRVYEVAASELVEGLAHEPVVIEDAPAGGGAWQELAVDWYLDDDRRPYLVAATGPDSWARSDADELDRAAHRALPAVTVGAIESDEDTISFTVDRTGVPVLVKTSYFPNWQARGAEGPYRVAPNLMVVVPTSAHVRLTYGRTPVDWLGIGMSGAGLLALAGLVVVPRRRRWAEAGGGRPPAAGTPAVEPLAPPAPVAPGPGRHGTPDRW